MSSFRTCLVSCYLALYCLDCCFVFFLGEEQVLGFCLLLHFLHSVFVRVCVCGWGGGGECVCVWGGGVCVCVCVLNNFGHRVFYPAGAAAGSYIASVSSSSSSSFFFFFFLLLSVNIAISPTAYMVWPCDSGIFISLMTATKLMGLEIHLGSFGVTGVKNFNHVKNMKTALI